MAVAEGDTTDLGKVWRNAAFPVLFPKYLPEATTVVSGRWWADGQVVELHTRTDGELDSPSDDGDNELRGKITIKEWTDAGNPAAGLPGRNPDATRHSIDGRRWHLSSSPENDIVFLEGTISGLHVQLVSTFPLKEAERVIRGLG